MIPPAPPLWATLCQLWHLDAGETARLWRAVYLAKWTVSAGLRQRLVLFEGQETHQRLQGVDTMVRHALTPAAIIDAVEALRAEGLLSPKDRIVITHKILTMVDASGQWRYPVPAQELGR
jgi:hypothetical protein